MARTDIHLRCTDCGHVGLKPLFAPDAPPDPNRHGGRKWAYKCPCCGERPHMYEAGAGSQVDLVGMGHVEYTVPL